AGSGYVIAASSGSLAVARSGAFAVTPATPAKLAITQPPATELVAGVPFNLGVSIEDEFGNVVTDADNPVHLGLLGGALGATLGGTSIVAAEAGVAKFDGLVLDVVGSHYVIQVSSPDLAGSVTAGLAVSPSSPTHLVITAEPSASVTAGDRFGLGVAVEDAFGNVVTGFDGSVGVYLERGPAGVDLSGETTVAAARGVATFAGLTLDK